MSLEEMSLPLHSWFWLIVPMITVFLLSIANYIRSRSRSKAAVQNNSRTGVGDRDAISGKGPASG